MENTNRILDVITEISRLERTVALLYSTCAKTYPKTEDLWKKLETEERNQVKYVEQILDQVKKEPEKFLPGRNFTARAVETVISGIEKYISQIKNFEMPEKRADSIAKDIEHSLLETNFFDVVSSSDKQFNTFIRTLASETKNHRDILDEQMKQYM